MSCIRPARGRTLAIGHLEGDKCVIDLVRAGLTIEQSAHLTDAYGINKVVGDEEGSDGNNLAYAVAGVISLLRSYDDTVPGLDIKRSQLAPSGHAAALCRREDYERSKEIMDDGAMAPATFEQYEKRWKAQLAQSEAMLGRKAKVVTLVLDEFLRFCEKHELKGRGQHGAVLVRSREGGGAIGRRF